MGLNRKQIVTRQKASFEQELKDRLSFLSEKGIKARQADRNPIVKKLKAEIKASNKRLARIIDLDKRTEEMVRIKAEKAAAPKKQPESAKVEKPKAAPKEGKAKKPKAPEGGTVQKKAGPSEESKTTKTP